MFPKLLGIVREFVGLRILESFYKSGIGFLLRLGLFGPFGV